MSSLQDASSHGVGEPSTVVDEVAWLLALRCIQRVGAARQVRLTGWLDRPRGGWPRADRRRLVEAASSPAAAIVHGAMVEEVLASQRWLAWFPRPIGPHHAVNVPSAVVDCLARRHPSLDLVRAHLAVPSWRAELLQAVGTLAGTRWGRRLLQRWVLAGRRTPMPASQWACVVEVVDAEQLLVRGWARGAGRTALATALRDRGVSPAATDGAAAAAVLDSLAAHPATRLRWSVGPPTPLGATGA